MTVIENKIVAPVDANETFGVHFSSRSWTTLRDQIEAGYPYLIQPTAFYGNWTIVKDWGSTFDAAYIKLSYLREDKVGSIQIRTHLAYSADNVTFTETQDVTSIFAQNFRYVRVTFEFGTLPEGTPLGILAAITTDSGGAGSDKDFAVISKIRLILDVEEISDGGFDTVSVADDGKFVTFNKQFADVTGLTVSPAGDGSVPIGSAWSFNDVQNPTGFTVFLYDTRDGTLLTGQFGWQAKGI